MITSGLILFINWIIENQGIDLNAYPQLQNQTVKLKFTDPDLIMYFVFEDSVKVVESFNEPIAVSIECSLCSLFDPSNEDFSLQGNIDTAQAFSKFIQNLDPVLVPLPKCIPSEMQYLWKRIQLTLHEHIGYAIKQNKDTLPTKESIKQTQKSAMNWFNNNLAPWIDRMKNL